MEEGFFIQVIEGQHSPFESMLERFPDGFPALMLADQITGRAYPARFKRDKSGDVFWLVDRHQLRPDQWMMLDALHGQSIECVWVNWELYAELTGELSADDRSDNEEMIYPLFVETVNISIVTFGSYFGISERWVEKSDPRIQRIIEAQTVLQFSPGKK